jgi:hypothetical protein
MSYETINVTPVTPRIGADVDGLTLAKPLSNRQVEELHQALAEHQVLFFRDQPLDAESHKALGRYFGELHIHPNTPGPEGHPEILPIHADGNSKRIAGEYWHSDVSCDEEPPLGSILYLHTVPPVGGDTLFASQYAAYDALSTRMKAYLEGLTATHSGDHLSCDQCAGGAGRPWQGFSEGIASGHTHSSRDQAQGAVRQSRIYHPYRRASQRGEPCHPELSIRALDPAGVPSAVPLAAPLGRILGQSQRSAHGVVGLLPPGPLRSPRNDQGGQAVLSPRMAH